MRRTNIATAVTALAGIFLVGATAQAAPVTLVQENFERADWSNPAGTAANLTNLPGGTWQKVAGYSTFKPQIAPATWASTPSKTLILGTGGTGSSGNTNVGMAIPLTGYYPTSISADAKTLWCIDTPYGSFAVGFYSASHAATDTNGVGYFTGFTGLSVSRSGTITLYENGTAGTSVATGTSLSWTVRTLSYSVNTSTGAISNIIYGGSAVSGITSAAFTPSATAYAAVVAADTPGGYSQTVVDNITVAGVVIPEPAGVALASAPAMLVLGRRRRHAAAS